jgi:hypothetical protein
VLIDELVPAGLVGEPVKDEVVAKAEGNPLYLEELLRALLETGGDRRRTWTITPKTAAELPPALEALLVARIDRLEPGARRLAQVASVVGREFPVSVAATVAAARRATSPRSFAPRSCARSGVSQSSSARSDTACCRRPRSRPSRPPSQRELYGRVGLADGGHLGDQVDERLRTARVLLLPE